jgi:hypothetical protein
MQQMNKEQKKWFASFLGALLFFVVSSPPIYKIVSNGIYKLSGSKITIASADGCPTGVGLVVHTIVFFLLVRALMEVPPLQQEEEKPKVASS